MKVNGFQLREAIKRHELRRNTSWKQFSELLFQFDSDDLVDVTKIAERFHLADEAVAKLQTARDRFNLTVTARVHGQKMTLSEMVKRVGGAGRFEKMWRDAAGSTGRDRYSYSERTRSKDQETAKRIISVDECLKRAHRAAKFAGELRNSIAVANTTEIDMDLDLSLFE